MGVADTRARSVDDCRRGPGLAAAAAHWRPSEREQAGCWAELAQKRGERGVGGVRLAAQLRSGEALVESRPSRPG